MSVRMAAFNCIGAHRRVDSLICQNKLHLFGDIERGVLRLRWMAQVQTISTRGGGVRMFSLAGINVYRHWSWAIIAAIQIQRNTGYSTRAWALAEYLVLFVIVLLHEFGHAFACRSVGGRADTIMLWPLGGVAFVQPPQRPCAMLW